jgi:hypothetical protein
MAQASERPESFHQRKRQLTEIVSYAILSTHGRPIVIKAEIALKMDTVIISETSAMHPISTQ